MGRDTALETGGGQSDNGIQYGGDSGSDKNNGFTDTAVYRRDKKWQNDKIASGLYQQPNQQPIVWRWNIFKSYHIFV